MKMKRRFLLAFSCLGVYFVLFALRFIIWGYGIVPFPYNFIFFIVHFGSFLGVVFLLIHIGMAWSNWIDKRRKKVKD